MAFDEKIACRWHIQRNDSLSLGVWCSSKQLLPPHVPMCRATVLDGVSINRIYIRVESHKRQLSGSVCVCVLGLFRTQRHCAMLRRSGISVNVVIVTTHRQELLHLHHLMAAPSTRLENKSPLNIGSRQLWLTDMNSFVNEKSDDEWLHEVRDIYFGWCLAAIIALNPHQHKYTQTFTHTLNMKWWKAMAWKGKRKYVTWFAYGPSYTVVVLVHDTLGHCRIVCWIRKNAIESRSKAFAERLFGVYKTNLTINSYGNDTNHGNRRTSPTFSHSSTVHAVYAIAK